jgi:GntR family transcriptional regulator
VRSARYREIADDLRHRLAAGEFASTGSGDTRLLPSESELSAAYAASRVTVRKALEGLRGEGLLTSRQGMGWQPALDPLRQTLGRLGTIEGQLADAGIESARRILDFGFVVAPARVRRVLDARRVLEVRRVNLADREPFARVTVWCAEALGRDLSLSDVERSSFYELLDVELGGATQTIAAAGATKADAEVLGLAAGSPVLLCTRVTSDVTGRPVLMSEHVFPAHRTEFVVDLPHVERSIAPNGLRLVGNPSA